MNVKSDDALNRKVEDELLEGLMVDLLRWAVNRDLKFREEIAKQLNEMHDDAMARLAADPTPEDEAERRAAHGMLGMLGLPGGE